MNNRMFKYCFWLIEQINLINEGYHPWYNIVSMSLEDIFKLRACYINKLAKYYNILNINYNNMNKLDKCLFNVLNHDNALNELLNNGLI